MKCRRITRKDLCLYLINVDLGEYHGTYYVLEHVKGCNLEELFQEFKKQYVAVPIEPLKQGANEDERLDYMNKLDRYPESIAFVKWLIEEKLFTEPETSSIHLDS